MKPAALYAFEATSSDEMTIHVALETYPGTDAKTKCSVGEIRHYYALAASEWPRAHDITSLWCPGMRVKSCPTCFAPEKYSILFVSANGTLLLEEPEIDFKRHP